MASVGEESEKHRQGTDIMTEEPKCPICGQQENLKKCKACHSVSYCSADHQLEHWKIHKLECSLTYEITKDPVLGKQWVAARDLKPGTILIDEKPIIYRPNWKGFSWVCLSCAMEFPNKKYRPCSTCGWPICSTHCEQVPMHKDNECFVFSSQKTPFPPPAQLCSWFSKRSSGFCNLDDPMCSALSVCIEFIRLLRLQKLNPTGYKTLMSEFYNCDEPTDSDFLENMDIFVSLLKRLVHLKELRVKEFEKDDFSTLYNVMRANNFTYVEKDSSKRRADVVGAYLLSSRMNHSCSPNVSSRLLPFPFSQKFRTTVFVSKGQPLTFNYFDDGLLRASRQIRQENILREWTFTCHCQRCLDPTELGSFMDGIACLDCRPDGTLIKNVDQKSKTDDDKVQVDVKNLGYFFPINPINFDPASEWKCNNCHVKKYFGVLNQTLTKLYQELSTTQGLMRSNRLSLTENILFLDRMEKKCKELIHPNHAILISLSNTYVTMFLSKVTGMTRPQFDKIVEKQHHLMDMDNIFSPGICNARAISLSRFASLISLAVTENPESFSKSEDAELFKTAMSYNDEARLYYDQDKNVVSSQKRQANALARFRAGLEENLRMCT